MVSDQFFWDDFVLDVLWIEMIRGWYYQSYLFTCRLDTTYFGLGEGSSLIGVFRMYFVLMFGSRFILGISGWIGDHYDFSPHSTLVRDVEFSEDIFATVVWVFVGSSLF